MQFRKQPVVIDAEQYVAYGRLVRGMCNSVSCYTSGNTEPHVHTIHDGQIVLLAVGDWVIPEPDGEHFYPCKPDIFAATYEPAPAEPQTPEPKIDKLWDRVLARCPHCRVPYRTLTEGFESCGHCGFFYDDASRLLDRIYMEVNAMGGTPFDGPVNTIIGEVLDMLRRFGAVDIETERR